jgi:putative spermidine/putrescine transport system ATP-binding protein
MRTEIKRIHRVLGCSTVYVTHDQDEALSLADRIVVLHGGKTQQIGNPEELYARPANLGVARFMGYRIFSTSTPSRSAERVSRCAGSGSASTEPHSRRLRRGR